MKQHGKVPGGAVVRTLHFPIHSLVGELKSCKPCSTDKKKEKQQHEFAVGLTPPLSFFLKSVILWSGNGEKAQISGGNLGAYLRE